MLKPSGSLTELLRAEDLLAPGSLARGVRLCTETGEKLALVLTRLGLITEQDLARVLSDRLGLPLVGRAEFPRRAIFREAISLSFLQNNLMLPLAETAESLVVAMADPLDAFAVDALSDATAKRVELRVATVSDIEDAIERLYQGPAEEAAAELINVDDRIEDGERLRESRSDAVVIRAVNGWIAAAVGARASDIHLEPDEIGMAVRYRVDGELRPAGRLDAAGGRAAVVARVKIMARLDTAERRVPQDGRMRVAVRGEEIDLRVSVIPGLHGEAVVMRILDRKGLQLDLAGLGFDGVALSRYLAVLERPHGIVLVTGPTGSGKTTTLYGSLARVQRPSLKILSVEDPIEYQIDGVIQTQVRPQQGLTFAAALRAFLRHDPDVIMVGEIRDAETARIAIQAALTGHLVLSTLHTNDAVSAVARLLDMGIEDYLIAATLNGVMAQRLVRTLCACRQPYEIGPENARKLCLPPDVPPVLFKAVGCESCRGTGHAGRTAIAEVLAVDETIRSDIAARRPIQLAGTESMYQLGLRKCLDGVIAVEELLRATHSF